MTMMPSLKPDKSWFIPYVYFPSGDASYWMIASPWGALKLSQHLAIQLTISLAIGLLSLFFWYRSRQKHSKADGNKASKSRDNKKESKSYRDAYRNDVHFTAQEVRSDSQQNRKSLTTYSWSDSKSRIYIYIDLEVSKEDIELRWTCKSFKFDIKESEGISCLHIPELYEEITSAKASVSKKSVKLTLEKTDPTITWKSLHAAAKNMKQNVIYDESLYD